MKNSFYKLASQARTINKLNRIRIAFENFMTPLELSNFVDDPELAELGVGLPAGKPPAVVKTLASGVLPTETLHAHRADQRQEARRERRPQDGVRAATEKEQFLKQATMGMFVPHTDWCQKLIAICNRSKKEKPESFERKRLRRNMYFYSSGNGTEKKVLALCFSGAARRMMMPLPVFLQHLHADLVDVVLLCDPNKDGYRSGTNRVQGDFDGMLRDLKAMLDDGPLRRDNYRAVIAIGTSSGGLPSILAGLRLELDGILAVGSNNPHDERWAPVGGIGAAALLANYAKEMSRPMPEIFLVYSADYPRDVASGQAIAEIIPVKHVCYDARKKQPIGHAILWPMVNDGKLSDLFDSTIFARFLENRKPNMAWITG